MSFDTSKFEDWLRSGLNSVKESPIGNVVDNAVEGFYERLDRYRDPAGVNKVIKQNEFEVNLLILAAAVIKADKETSKFELDYVREFLLKNFDNQFIESKMYLLEKILVKKFNLKDVCAQIKRTKPHGVRLQLVQFLLHVADADLIIKGSELKVIQEIVQYFDISDKEYRTILAMFDTSDYVPPKTTKTSTPKNEKALAKNPYAVLDVDANASEEEVKDAYHTLAKKFHPDKVMHLGESVKNKARDSFQRIQDAYAAIKKMRGW